ncbi:MAG: acetyl-CoA acetyltransferase [Gammaproteobacteria bacterium]|nr:acetyl-CoA acetyltransferase [Gammaproteobacteria bacterium]
MTNPNSPVIVGVGQFLNRLQDLEEALEPLEMMLRAMDRAEQDTGVGDLLQQVQSVRVIRGVWHYANPAQYLAQRIGAVATSGSAGVQSVGTLFGGNQNQAVVNRTAASILAGDLDLVVITGAENGYSAGKARKAGVKLETTETPGDYDLLIGAQKPEHHDFEIAKGIRAAIQVYPMYENAIRHHRGESLGAHMDRVSSLWARFNDAALTNPNAWVQEDYSAEQIRTPSAANRQISFPYTKLMNANMSVDMSAALIMCSVQKARALGIAEQLWVYPYAGVEGYDHFSASVRENFYSSPGVRLVGKKLFELTATDVADLTFVDLYSCFPSAVQIAAMELGLDENRPLTVTGGLTFGGGPLNNYVMHSIARMVELLRAEPGTRGLVTANGGNLYKHAHGIYSAAAPVQDFQFANVQAEIDRLPSKNCLASYQGPATIESYTVMYSAVAPTVGHVACLTPAGERTWVNTEDPELMGAMASEEFCGRPVKIDSAAQLSVLA